MDGRGLEEFLHLRRGIIGNADRTHFPFFDELFTRWIAGRSFRGSIALTSMPSGVAQSS